MRKIYFLLFFVFSFFAATKTSFGQYCTVTFPSNVEPITLVNIGTINNVTSATLNGTPALENFTALSTNVTQSSTYPITVKGNTDGPFTTVITVFVDWNQNFILDDAGETYSIGTITNSTGVDAIQVVGNILVPAGALNGSTRMRVMKRYLVAGIPCNTTGFGQAEDYTLNVGVVTPCVAPPGGGTATGPAGSICAGASFNLSVSGASFGSGLTYLWETSPNDLAPWTPTGATTASYTTSATTSTYYRRRITCSAVDAYSTSVLVTITPPLAIPFTETFAGYATLFPPACWSNSNPTYLGGLAPSAFGVGSGSARYNFFSSGSGTIMDLATAAFAPVPANYRVTFDEAYATYSGEVDQLQVLYSTNGGTTYTNLATYLGGAAGPLNTGGTTTAVFSPTAAQWANKTITLPVGTNKLIFRGVSGFGNNLFIDNITVEPIPPCLPPTNLSIGAQTPTSTVLNWTASPSAPSGGYEWEVRTAGAPGSGGAVTSGSTAATTVNATGLTPNTTYSYYVRANCGGGVFSSWTLAFVFTTPCNPIGIPFTETFSTYATTFPPTCWSRNNATYLLGQAPSAYGVGTGSAKFDYYNANAGTNLDLVSPLFTPVPANYRLTFDHAYATFFGENDQLQIFYSTDGGGTYTSLILYDGGNSGPLNTGGAVLPAFSPTADQWANKAIDLPVGTNRLRFRGISAFGNNLFVDNITVEPTPTCLPVSNLTAVGISPTEVLVTFTPPATTPTVGYIVEYGAVGFTPGTGNTAGTGGTVFLGPASPIMVTGLTPNTTYDFYVRKICIAGVDFSINRKTTATTLCPATNIPYLQNMESATVPAMPTCTSRQDVNGNSGSFWLGTGAGGWETYTDANPLTYVSPSKALLYYYDFNNLARGGDDWFYIQGLNLTLGTTYRLKFFYKALDGVNYPEKLEVKYGTRANAADMTSGTLFTNNNISSVYGSGFDSVRVDFTPSSTGVFYIGFHITSDPDEFGLLLDDISVKLAPLVDVGITAITLPSLNCPTNNVFLQATVKNFNTTTQNFATYPVTVSSTINGVAGPGAVLNTGTLAPGASMDIYLSPAYNFTGGVYDITVKTATTPAGNDPETGNDAFTTSITVNPNPPVPVITPANPAICAGTPVQLSTQFTPSPPPVTLPAVSSGTIAVAIPDNTPAGITHTLAVAGVPAGANVTAVSVTLNMTHTWIGDMIINLKAPNGNVLNLINQRGANGDNLSGTIITSATGAASLASGAAPFTGTFAPDANAANPPTAYPQSAGITNFNGLMSVGNGNWILALRDNAGFDLGVLTSWSITITYQILTPTITWTPTAGLYTNAGATTAYTGGNAFSLYANPPATSTYTVTATTLAGCTSSATTTVTVNPLPVVTVGSIPDTVCISDPLIALPASPVGGTWSGVGVSGMNFVPPATAVGTYTLTYSYTSLAGCTVTATKKIAVKDCPERIILLSDNALLLYPNPNTGLFNIKINSVLYNNLVMKVYKNNGVLVRTQALGGLAWGRVVPIDLTNLPGGVYMVKFYYDGGVRTAQKTFKVIIGHE